MPNHLNKNILIERVQASAWPNSLTDADLEAIDSLADRADYSLLKPLSRKTLKTIKHSLYNIDNIPSVKLQRIGAGSYAKVYIHADALPGEQTPHVYVVKVVHLNHEKEKEYKNKDLRRGIEHEITVLKGLNRYLRHGERLTSSGQTKLYIVMRHIPGKTLYHYFNSQKYKLSAAKALQMMVLIAEQLSELHALGYAHGDLHTGNIMMEDSPFMNRVNVRLIDFNLSRPEGEPCSFEPLLKKNEFPHIPDECCETAKVFFTYSTDVFALGDVFNHFPERTSQLSPEISDLINKMKAPAQSRCTLEEVITTLKEIQKQLKTPVVRKPFQPMRLTFTSEPAPVPEWIPTDVKNKALRALRDYLIGQHTWRPYFLDGSFLRKSEFMRNQINLITVAETKQIFNEKLVQSLKEYTEQFVLPQLSHYAERPNLGRGIECFVNAIKACAEEALVELALKELSSVLPSKSPQGESFLNKFRQLLALPNSKTLIKPT